MRDSYKEKQREKKGENDWQKMNLVLEYVSDKSIIVNY